MNAADFTTAVLSADLKVPEQQFFLRDTAAVAQDLLFSALIKKEKNGTVSGGRIVETEAYAPDDPVSHSFCGKTARNAAMFLAGGHVYVYQIYGIHYCFNVVTEGEGIGSAVLIRALEPWWGIQYMQERRKGKQNQELTNGPAKITQALRITAEENTLPLFKGPQKDRSTKKTQKSNVLGIRLLQKDAILTGSSVRIGVHEETPRLLRFFIQGNLYLSRNAPRKM